ncbi:MAG: sphingomyelin phosphodiesterase [Oligoflexia bacterium]|nr:sphingomyelin phosphodiesterase [Oligoflexia bacterium]
MHVYYQSYLFFHLFFIFIALTISLTTNLYATTTVYIQNNTSLSFNLKIEQTGSTLDRTKWLMHRQTLPAWEPRSKVLTFNRNRGIKKGKSYFWKIKVLTEKDEEIAIFQHELVGTTFFSDLKVLVNGAKIKSMDPQESKALTETIGSWKHDTKIHSYEFSVNKMDFILKYKIDKGSNCDVTYLIHQKQPFPKNDIENGNKLFVLTYNTYGIFTQKTRDIQKRFSALPEAIDGLGGEDILIFNEAFKNKPRQKLVEKLKNKYPYITKVIDAPLNKKLMNGGVFIASKWKIEKTDQLIYENCGFPDCFSAKGVQYIKIIKKGYPYHIFATHINYDGHPEIRMKQLKELKNFVTSKKIPKDEAVIIGGDLNIDINRFPYDYQRMLDTIDCSKPELQGYRYSNDTAINLRARLVADEKVEQCRYDYILAQKGHIDPISASNEVRICKSSSDSIWDSWEISDHFPVQGIFTFPKKKKEKLKVE